MMSKMIFQVNVSFEEVWILPFRERVPERQRVANRGDF
jgi:hypothetical protein